MAETLGSMLQGLLAEVFLCALGALFLAGAVAKAGDIARFASQIAAYRLLPLGAAFPAAYVIISLQGCIAVLLMLGVAPVFMAAAAAGLLCVFAVAVGINVARGRTNVDCGCVPGISAKLSWRLAMQNCIGSVLALLAGYSARPLGIFLHLESLLLGAGALTLVLALMRLGAAEQPA